MLMADVVKTVQSENPGLQQDPTPPSSRQSRLNTYCPTTLAGNTQ